MTNVSSMSLLIGLREEGNSLAWVQFCDRYRGLLVAFALRLGLTQSDAEDAVQETLLAFLESFRQGRYERDKGRLGQWLFGIARNKVHYLQRQRGRELVILAKDDQSGLLSKVADDHSISQVWEEEWRRAVLKACIEEVRGEVEPSTMKAFELLALEECSPAQAASQLGMTVNAVMKAKRRVLSRMRDLYDQIKDEW